MPDPLNSLFDDLRRDTLPQVRPPGAEAARRTVHRRATVRAAALAAVVIAVGGTWIVSQRNLDGTITPAASASASTYASDMLWRGRADKTEIAAALVPGASHSDVMAEHDQDVGLEADGGNYRLRVGCAGPAPLPVTVMVNETVDQQQTLQCTDDGVARDFEITVPSAGSVRVILSGIGQFDAYALRLEKL
ncbi:hypothetical protein JIG36_34285 [Actinoplanes sp. LDG1-06]|uniref:Uncharacterized protein n=1 Tax=Paractinoplanes ovalisporus TaxID=2810368 RepID=A0ABS2ALD8_9ACTN|nr:hypothetical protein [Actinoplanes ovalisporus]MBM2620583.1 hypothetical protein [Actinoplanes ovalisporus]